MNNEPKREDYPTDDAFIEAMAKHHGIDPRMCKQLPQEDYLKAENVRLKIEVERLDKLVRYWSGKHKSVKEAFERASDSVKETQAEVERLTEAWVDKKMQEDRDALLAHIERLTKAGDALAGYAIEKRFCDYHLLYDKIENVSIDEVDAWHAAKQGGQR